jgi:hypothetical protein
MKLRVRKVKKYITYKRPFSAKPSFKLDNLPLKDSSASILAISGQKTTSNTSHGKRKRAPRFYRRYNNFKDHYNIDQNLMNQTFHNTNSNNSPHNMIGHISQNDSVANQRFNQTDLYPS